MILSSNYQYCKFSSPTAASIQAIFTISLLSTYPKTEDIQKERIQLKRISVPYLCTVVLQLCFWRNCFPILWKSSLFFSNANYVEISSLPDDCVKWPYHKSLLQWNVHYSQWAKIVHVSINCFIFLPVGLLSNRAEARPWMQADNSWALQDSRQADRTRSNHSTHY